MIEFPTNNVLPILAPPETINAPEPRLVASIVPYVVIELPTIMLLVTTILFPTNKFAPIPNPPPTTIVPVETETESRVFEHMTNPPIFVLPMIPIPPFTTTVPVLLETDATFPFTERLF